MYLDELDIPQFFQSPPLEVDLEVEVGAREVKSCQDIEEVKEYAIELLKQARHQEFIVNKCLEKIAELQAVLICKENKVIQRKKMWWSNFF